MTNNTPVAPAGWYPDPTTQGQERFFDGTIWTEQRREATMPSPDPGAVRPGKPLKNGAATAAFWVGGAQIVTWVLGWFAPAFAGISMALGVPTLVLGIVGTVRSRRTGKGKANSITAIVIGGLAMILAIFPLASSSVRSTPMIDRAALEQSIKDSVKDQSIQVTVTCPDDQPLTRGTTFTCILKSSDGQTAAVDVTVQNDKGDLVWKPSK